MIRAQIVRRADMVYDPYTYSVLMGHEMQGLLVNGRYGYAGGMTHAPAPRTWFGRLYRWLFG